MKQIILYTQRVEVVKGYGERRDCADQQISKFLWTCGFVPVPAGNTPEYIQEYVGYLRPGGIVLTGGNDLEKYGGKAPERDQTERLLLEYAICQHIPVIGFCRGMQVIADYFGSQLLPIQGHAGCRHQITGELSRQAVKSYHNWGLKSVTGPIRVLAHAEDGVVEAICHSQKKMMGIMWHPERETPYQEADIRLFSDFLKGNARL